MILENPSSLVYQIHFHTEIPGQSPFYTVIKTVLFHYPIKRNQIIRYTVGHISNVTVLVFSILDDTLVPGVYISKEPPHMAGVYILQDSTPPPPQW